ncbi:MAG TPA: NTP transferase domain-containing protein [Phycisphaerae bacterium]|nr:NTP transferase domain-containing protein [Phycisphaerae bacterium]
MTPKRSPPAARRSDVIAGVLVGGAGRRMGRPKALLPHPAGGTFVEHVVAVLSPLVSEVVLLGRPSAAPPQGPPRVWPGVPRVPDEPGGGGPLAGLCSLLRRAGDRWALLLACDLPLLGPETLAALLAATRTDVDAVAFVRNAATEAVSSPAVGGRARDAGAPPSSTPTYHACCAAYHPRVLAEAEAELRGGAALQALLRRARLGALEPDARIERQLTNVNTPEQVAELAALWRRGPGGA